MELGGLVFSMIFGALLWFIGDRGDKAERRRRRQRIDRYFAEQRWEGPPSRRGKA